MYGQERIRTGD